MTITLPSEAKDRLAQQFGIPVSMLIEAIIDASVARSACTPLHPRGFKGISGWAANVAGLRARLIPLGWTPVDTPQNLATVVSPDGTLAIAISSGDANTGNPLASPKTRNEKGQASRAAVEENERQGMLFGELPVVLKQGVQIPPGRTYWLLTHHTKDKIYFELSLPMALDEDDRLSEWHDRILFDPIELMKPMATDDKEEERKQDEIVVEVTRKK